MSGLTQQQRAVLVILAREDTRGATPAELAEALTIAYQNRTHGTDTIGKEGAAATASSLARRGLVYRNHDDDGHVFYRLTHAGTVEARRVMA